MKNLSKLINWLKGTSLITQIAIGLTAGVVLGLTVPQWTSLAIFGKIFVSALKAVAIGFIIGVVQDSVETALNSSSDVFFTATAEYYDRRNNK